MNRYHLVITKYPWAKTGIRPKSRHTTAAVYNYHKYMTKIRMLLSIKNDHMNPFQRWHNENPELKPFLEDLYGSYLSPDNSPNLVQISDRYIKSDNVNLKFCAITTAAAMKFYGG